MDFSMTLNGVVDVGILVLEYLWNAHYLLYFCRLIHL